MHRAVFGGSSRPNKALAAGRLVLVFELGEQNAPDVPTTTLRAADDLSAPRRRTEKLHDAGLPEALLSRLVRRDRGGHRLSARLT